MSEVSRGPIEQRSNADGRTWLLYLVCLISLASFLRFETLGQRPLWSDELAVRRFVLEAERNQGYLHARANPAVPGTKTEADLSPLHTLLAYGTLALGRSNAALRVPAALAGVASVVLLAALAQLLYDRRTGVCVGLLAALSVYQINYSQDARAYSLLLALGTAQYLAFFLFLRGRSQASLVGFVLSGTASLYAHHLAALNQLTLAIIVAGFIVQGRVVARPADRAPLSRSDLLRLVLAFAAIALLYLPQLGTLLDFAGSEVSQSSVSLSPSWRFADELVARWGGGEGPITRLYEFALLVGIAAAFWRRGDQWVLLVWLASPFVFFTLLPFAKFFDIRYVISAYAPFVILAGAGFGYSADAVARLAVRLGAAAQRAGKIKGVCLATICLAIGMAAGQGYLAFRSTELRCSDFFQQREILQRNQGFCRRYILLNTIIPEDRYMLRPR